jgi:hypothetical protein
MNKITSIKEVEPVIRDTSRLETPQIEVKEETPLKHEQLLDALMFAEDVLTRAVCPFVALGETAETINTWDMPIFEGKGIYLGVMKRHLTKDALSTIKSYVGAWAKNSYIDEDVISFEYNNVPTYIQVISGDYPFFKNPDVRFFNITEVRIPNPFDEYWKWRDQIK